LEWNGFEGRDIQWQGVRRGGVKRGDGGGWDGKMKG